MSYQIRDIQKELPQEVDLVVHRCMHTVLETIPEFQGDAELALKTFPNFTFEQMKKMILDSLEKPNHRILVAVDNEQKVHGHAIFSHKMDEQGTSYGFCFSRFVDPEHRRKGLAERLLQAAEQWWKENGAQYAVASTHVTNHKLQGLFLKNGYTMSEPKKGKLEMVGLRKEL